MISEPELARLKQDVCQSKRAAFATGTKMNLHTQWKAFVSFCIYFALVPVPVSTETLLLYVQFLSRQFKSVQSIKNYVNGVRLLHLYKGVEFPHTGNFELGLLYKGLNRNLRHAVKQVLPINVEVLLAMSAHINWQSPLDITLWCCFLLAFFLFARKSNMVPPSTAGFNKQKHLQRCDIMYNMCGLIVRFKWSKTIQCGERMLLIPVTAIPGSILCPVTAYRKMCDVIPAPLESPAFITPQNGKCTTLTYSSYVYNLRRLLNLAGYKSENYSGHSFRRGGASAAFKAGVPSELVRLHGDWHSDAYLKYLVMDMQEKLSVSKMMAHFIKNF